MSFEARTDARTDGWMHARQTIVVMVIAHAELHSGELIKSTTKIGVCCTCINISGITYVILCNVQMGFIMLLKVNQELLYFPISELP